MQWEGQSACVQVSASNEELQKMFAERERTARPHQPPSRTQELVSMGGIGDPKASRPLACWTRELVGMGKTSGRG